MPFFSVKAIHHHEAAPSAICQTTDDAGQPQSPCDDCPICHFSLEPFTPGESLNLCVTFSYIEHEPGTLLTPLFGQPAAPYDLRGPPTC